MKTEKEKERYRQWRKENPEKVAAQRARYKARKSGQLESWVKPEKPTAEQIRARNIERQKSKYLKRKERLASDPEFAAAYRAKERARAVARYAKVISDPAIQAAKNEKERIRRAEKQRLKAEVAAKPQRTKMTPEERRLRRRFQQNEYDRKKREKLRAERSAEVSAAIAKNPPKTPVFCPDPPELQALFAKASKGQRPIDPYYGKKMGAFTARTKWM